jgi:hypothetical protein
MEVFLLMFVAMALLDGGVREITNLYFHQPIYFEWDLGPAEVADEYAERHRVSGFALSRSVTVGLR